MNLFITCINGIGGAAKTSQENVLQIGKRFGAREMNIYVYPPETDNASELSHRLDGIIAGLQIGDLVILQYPTWNHLRFDHTLINKLNDYRTKLILFVHDVDALMWTNDLIPSYLREEVKLFNRADLLILPSQKMHDTLKEYGLTVQKVLIQPVWDYPTPLNMTSHAPLRRFYFPGWQERSPFLLSYTGKTPIQVYSVRPLSRENDESVRWMGYRDPDILLKELSEGGFGLVWSDGPYHDKYLCMNQSFKVGTFLAAGIPVIVRRGTAYADFVERNRVGFVVDSVEEADTIVQNIRDEEFKQLYKNVSDIQFLITHGHYTGKLLEEAIVKVMEK